MPVPQREQAFVVSWSDEGGYRRKGVFWPPSEATFWKQKCVLMYWFHILWWWSAPALLPSLLPETDVLYLSGISLFSFISASNERLSICYGYLQGRRRTSRHEYPNPSLQHSLTGIFRSDANLSLPQSHGVWASDTSSSWEVPAGSLSWLQSSVSAFWTSKASCWQQLDAACNAWFRLMALLFCVL